ncbi:transaldolase [Nostocoides sp. F2B08]|uniref:transaldolase n=1 Tax=Nostocoides sp. F2B08 TaxID=2653936 RepID=UPI00126345CD|nr:transaldolase [Tetrasphaera sp. F2B08]KAB7744243.1 transaldolase [Tetrasphaera sp. F2B08]
MTNPLHDLAREGVSVWLDDLSRERLVSGSLAALVADGSVVGVTTNPSIFKAAITGSDLYDEQIAQYAKAGADGVVRALTTDDVREACDLLAPVHERSGGVDGRVSIEVDPRLAHNADSTLIQAHELWHEVDRPNMLVKIPATLAGLPAIRSAIAEGISVNVTLIFSLERYRAVMEAYLAGLEQRLAAGESVAGIASVASFFVSRVDTAVDSRLEEIGTPEALELRGKAAVANARLAYRAYEETFSGERWERLREAGAWPQRPLWASTGVKNPEYADTLYVTELVAPGTVNTMPEATLEAVADHGEVRGDTVRSNYDDAAAVITGLRQVGVELDDITHTLEEQGVESFENAWNELLESVDAAISERSAAR